MRQAGGTVSVRNNEGRMASRRDEERHHSQLACDLGPWELLTKLAANEMAQKCPQTH